MTPAEEGAYIRLLAIAWSSDDCGLPNDDNELAILSRLHEGWFNGGSTKIRKCFVVKGTRLYNKRLLQERKKQEEWREKSREGGIISGKIRKNKGLESKGWLKGRSTTQQRVVEPKGNSSSSSSSSLINKNITEQFEKFWKIYPSRNGRKVTKKESLLFFKDNFKTEEEINLLLKATQNYSAMTKEGFAKDAIRFLKKDFWRDWIEKTEDKEYEEVTGVGSGNKY